MGSETLPFACYILSDESNNLNFIKIGRLYHIAAIGTIGKLVGK